ncbi:MAG: TonB-dependent receptor [Pseudomonadota bacterium]
MHPSFSHRRALLATLIASLVHGVAVAEEAQLPTISITASPLTETQPLNSSAVDTEELKSMQPATSDTASLLKNIPGLNLQGAGGVSSLPVIHGLGDDRLRIKVDGMDIISACENHMNPALSYIDPTSVGSATVFAGISPVSLGGDSIGGSIIVESADPEFAKPGEGILTKGEIGAFARSNGNASGANLSATVASETVSLTYRGSTAESDNYKAGDDFKISSTVIDVGDRILDDDEVGSTMYHSTNQSLTLGMRNDNHLVELKAGMQDIPFQGYPNQRMDMTGNDSTHTNLSYEGQLDWGTLEARAYNEHTRHYMQFYDDKLFWYGPSAPTDYSDSGIPGPIGGCPTPCTAAGMPMDTEGDNTGVVIKADIPLSSGDLIRIGGETQQYRLDDWWDPAGKGMWPDTFWSIKDGERDRLAIFSEWEAQWGPEWLSQLGIRGEQVNMNAGEVQGYGPKYDADATAFNDAERKFTDDNLDLTALLRFTPDTTRTIEFGLAQKTRSPNLYERYAWSTGGMAMRMINWAGDGNGYVGNLELEPEVAHTVSATFDWHDAANEKWGLKVTPHYTYVSDYIDAERCSGAASGSCVDANLTVTDNFVYLQFVNQSASIYGIDISGHFPLSENTAYGNLTATGILSYTRGENDTTGDNLYNIMPLNVKLAAVQQLKSWNNTVEVELVDAKEDVSATRNEVETEAYGLVHIRSSYKFGQARLDFGIENLFDTFYNDPLGGAYTGEGPSMTGSGVAWGVPVPGAGRSIYFGVNVQF